MTTMFVEGPSGSVVKMDVPTDPHGAERFHAAVKNGQLTVIEESRIIEVPNPRWPECVLYKVDRSIAATADIPPAVDAADGPSDELAAKSKQDLFDVAAGLGVETKASWSKAQLIAAIESHNPDGQTGAEPADQPDAGGDPDLGSSGGD